VFSSNLQLANAPALASALAAQNVYVGAARYFTNAVDTRTKGVDVVSTYRLNLQQGARADLTLAYNHNDNEVQARGGHAGRAVGTAIAAGGPPERQPPDRRFAEGQAELERRLTHGAWNGRAAVTRYGKFTVPQNDAALDQTYDPQWVLDLAASVRVASAVAPDGRHRQRHQPLPGAGDSLANLNVNGTQPYSVWAPNGFNGRYFYPRQTRRLLRQVQGSYAFFPNQPYRPRRAAPPRNCSS
jgi:iron complex outermembrane receptor protein